MKKKLFGLAFALGITALASWAGTAEAIAYCSPTYCAGKPLTTKCACPPGTDRVGSSSNCGAYTGISSNGCWYE